MKQDSRQSPPRRQSRPPGEVPPQSSPTATPWVGTASSWPAHPRPEFGLGHLKKFGPPSDYPRITQLAEEVLSAVEILHLNVDRTKFSERVGIRSSDRRSAKDFA